jgi:hypothetical protein
MYFDLTFMILDNIFWKLQFISSLLHIFRKVPITFTHNNVSDSTSQSYKYC